MGYTHYWRQKGDFDKRGWEKIVEDVKKAEFLLRIRNGCEVVQRDYDDDRLPQFDRDAIWFNGIGEDGHETFSLQQIQPKIPHYQIGKPEDGKFDFCKTARKPYDALVCATLLIAQHHAPETIFLSSDGDWDDWEEGRGLAAEVLGVEPKECFKE